MISREFHSGSSENNQHVQKACLSYGTGIAKTLETHNAVCHKECYNKTGQKEYNRLLARVRKKPCSEAISSSSTAIPHKRTNTELGTELCIFCGERDSTENLCAAREFHSGCSKNNQHVQKLFESWSEMALATGDLDVHAKLCASDVRSNEIFYHKNHLSQSHNRYRASQTKKDDGTDQSKKVLRQIYAWRQISNNIHQSVEYFIAANVLEKKYAALMDAYNPSYTPHKTQFLKLLEENVSGLNDSKLHGVNHVSIREKTGKDAEEPLNPCTLHDMMERISKAIRIKLKDVKNEFNGSFIEESPLPCELLILLNLLMNGSNHEEPGFSLPVKGLAQIILYNHRIQGRRKELSGEPHQRYNTDKESPFLLEIGLKVFSATRSSETTDILHAHGFAFPMTEYYV